jgi:S-adenosylmethionine:tRNA ribosyltransferase-isomerase
VNAIALELPQGRDATEPPEARGLARDGVRLLVADGEIHHARFRDLGRFLRPGDLLVVNDSATIPAAVDATTGDGRPVNVHFATELAEHRWVVEVRPAGASNGPLDGVRSGDRFLLPSGAVLSLREPYPTPDATRLWDADVAKVRNLHGFLERFGRPVTYSYVTRRWPLSAYQTVFGRRPGSAEMPSAGRPFTAELVTELVSSGVAVAPITLHTGLSSPEAGEPPAPERYAVPAATAALVNQTKASGGRLVAVGTTVVRALETVADVDGRMSPGSGWTDLVLGPCHPARSVDAIVTGWHASGASHLDLLEAVAGTERLEHAYREAAAGGYLWHEFGDSALLFR